VHHDDHDVFVLQTAGRKRWLVYDKPASGNGLVLLHDVELARETVDAVPRRKCGGSNVSPRAWPTP